MAELPFLYQRVYCPIKEQLTYLTPLSDFEEWSPEKEAYVGRDLDAELAKGIAEGSVDPISLEPMVDINPSYTPHIQGQKHAVKVKPKPEKGTLTNYFRVVPKDQPSTSSAIPRRPTIHIGNSSGLKTLSEQMESERSTKQAKQCANDEGLATSSKFFAQPSVTTGRETTPPLASKRKRCDEDSAIFTPRAPRRTRPEKENEPIEIIDPVMQEPGYQSPCSIADVSSPIERMSIADDVEDHARSASPQWKVDNIQSPSQVCTPRRSPLHSRILCQETPPLVPFQKASLVLVLDTPPPNAVQDLSQSQSFGIDLRDTFRDDHDDGSDGDSSGPETPEDTQLEEHANVLAVEQDVIDLTKSDFDDIEVLADDEAQKVMNGWRTQWSHKASSKNKLKLPLVSQSNS
ncbi:Rad2 nuclease [Tulasnella sp. 418]|nr:Rad2 nuclease [Tulasnella sp. 418]